MKKIFVFSLRISISILLLVLLFKKVDLGSIIGIIKGADKTILAIAFILNFSVYLFCIFRWKMILEALDIKVAIKDLITPFSAGIFFSSLLPSTIGGDFVRTADMAIHTKKTDEVVASVLLDRLSGYIGVVFVTIAAFLLGFRLVNSSFILLSLFLITSILFVILLVFFNRKIFLFTNRLLYSPTAGKIRAKVENIHKEIHHLRHHKTLIYKNLLISVLIQAISPVIGYLISLSLGVSISPFYFFVFLPIIGTIILLPISLGGIGFREALAVLFFAKVNVGNDVVLAFTLIGTFIQIVYAAIGGLIYVFTLRNRRI